MERITRAARSLLRKSPDPDDWKVKVRIEVYASVVETSSSRIEEPRAFPSETNASENQREALSAEPSPALSRKVRKQLPYDVLPYIVADIITEAIHALSRAKTQKGARRMWWEREMVRCLAQVSSGMRDATKQVIAGSFLILDDDEG